LEATYGIQALAQEGLISYNEFVFKNSQVEFTMNKTDLQEFEVQHPELEYVVKGLLRSYEGIFDSPTNIYETVLAKFLKSPASKIIEDLKKLATYGVIIYTPPAEKPQVLLLQNRMYNDDIKINSRELAARKEHALQRAKAIGDFINNTAKCRSRMIASYFGDHDIPDCGICDNCITNTDAELPAEEFARVAEKVRELAATEKYMLKDILKLLRPVRERSSWLVIQFLLGEEIISSDKNNVLTLNKRTIISGIKK
jgi:ATP-dependent DNA helicase RecQ